MHLKQLQIANFRNLLTAEIMFSQKSNVFIGQNGSGKTALLEAVSLIGLGRSFRAHQWNQLIHHHHKEEGFTLYGLYEDDLGLKTTVGIHRKKNQENQIKLRNKDLSNRAELASIKPIILLNNDSFYLLTEGPRHRREYLDRGLFHVEPSFIHLWREYQRALKQRNSLLKMKKPKSLIEPWNIILAQSGERIHLHRKQYLEQIQLIFESLIEQIFEGYRQKIQITYNCGWDEEQDLYKILQTSFARDNMLGYTEYGIHRADLAITLNDNINVKDHFSRGQIKLLVLSLLLAQGMHLYKSMNKASLFLIDDITAELDTKNTHKVLEILQKINAQSLITIIEDNNEIFRYLNPDETRMFHVKHGVIETI